MTKYAITTRKQNKKLMYFNSNITIKSIWAKVLIVRGIGYRAFTIENDFLNMLKLSEIFVENQRNIYTCQEFMEKDIITQTAFWEFSKSQYLIIRAGHTRDLSIPASKSIKAYIGKKERKLTIASENVIATKNLLLRVYNYRPPSAYTGRGVRIKHEKLARKAGKKDKQRGKTF